MGKEKGTAFEAAETAEAVEVVASAEAGEAAASSAAAESTEAGGPGKAAESDAASEHAAAANPNKKKKKRDSRLSRWGNKKAGPLKRWQLSVVVLVVVFGAAGAGLYAWHETPGFCGAICHASMDGYVPTYEATPGEPAVDKWGNEVSDASGMLAAVHRVDAKITCTGCHKPVIAEQITEGTRTVTGDYVAPLSERNLDNLTAYENYDDSTEFCLNEGCHNMTKSELTEKTAGMTRNPHSWHHFQYTCTDCHKSHRASVLVCTSCHSDSLEDLPAGWLSEADSKKLATMYGTYDNQD